MNINSIREWFRAHPETKVSVKYISQVLGLSVTYCGKAMQRMHDGNELVEITGTNYRKIYKAVNIKLRVISAEERAAIFLNSKPLDFEFTRLELANYVDCYHKSLSNWLSVLLKKKYICVISQSKKTYTYRRVEVISEKPKQVKRNKETEVIPPPQLSQMHAFAFGGNPETVKANLYY